MLDDDCMIYIASAGRPQPLATVDSLPEWMSMRARIVVQRRELHEYSKVKFAIPIIMLPDEIRTYTPTREWIGQHALEHGWSKFFIVDDDLRFARRIDDTGIKLRKAKPKDVGEMFATLADWLSNPGIGIVGVSARWENWHTEKTVRFSAPVCRLAGYRTSVHARCKLRVPTCQDSDVTMQILRMGYAAKVSYEFAYEQPAGNQSAGGCSTYRTAELESRSSQEIVQFHKPYVTGGWDEKDARFPGKKVYRVTRYNRKAAYLSGLPPELR